MVNSINKQVILKVHMAIHLKVQFIISALQHITMRNQGYWYHDSFHGIQSDSAKSKVINVLQIPKSYNYVCFYHWIALAMLQNNSSNGNACILKTRTSLRIPLQHWCAFGIKYFPVVVIEDIWPKTFQGLHEQTFSNFIIINCKL